MSRHIQLRIRRAIRGRGGSHLLVVLFLGVSFSLVFLACHLASVSALAQEPQGPVRGESQEEAMARSTGCVSCHTSTDEPTMHPSKGVHLGCTDCHGGNNTVLDSLSCGVPVLAIPIANDQLAVSPVSAAREPANSYP